MKQDIFKNKYFKSFNIPASNTLSDKIKGKWKLHKAHVNWTASKHEKKIPWVKEISLDYSEI